MVQVSNDFKQQEPGKIRQPLYDWLVTNSPVDAGKEVGWNFEKFLISKDGKIAGRFVSKVTPEIEKALK